MKSKVRFKKGDKVRANYDISCSAFTIPSGTVVTVMCVDRIFSVCDVQLNDGRYMDDVEIKAFSLIE